MFVNYKKQEKKQYNDKKQNCELCDSSIYNIFEYKYDHNDIKCQVTKCNKTNKQTLFIMCTMYQSNK